MKHLGHDRFAVAGHDRGGRVGYRLALDHPAAVSRLSVLDIIPTGEVYDGEEVVNEYFRVTRDAFPDQRNENAVLHHADDAVIVEFDLLGTHEGELRGIPPTGRSFRCPVVAFFLFEPGGEGIVCERVYFDRATILEQLMGEDAVA